MLISKFISLLSAIPITMVSNKSFKDPTHQEMFSDAFKEAAKAISKEMGYAKK